MAFVTNAICLLILIGFNGFLLSESTCYTDILYQLRNQNGSTRMVGAYQRIDNVTSDKNVLKILNMAVSRINSSAPKTGPHWQLNYTKNGQVQNVTAYRQVVAGMNYCARFLIKSNVTVKGVRGKRTTKTLTKTCDAKGFVGLPIKNRPPRPILVNYTCT